MAASVLWTLGVAAPVLLFAGYRLSRTVTRRLAEIAETAVSDDGPGMPTSERDRVFERFYQGAEGRSGNSGSGLGLSLARSICSVHGFKIAALEVPGGAAFEVSIA